MKQESSGVSPRGIPALLGREEVNSPPDVDTLLRDLVAHLEARRDSPPAGARTLREVQMYQAGVNAALLVVGSARWRLVLEGGG